MYINQPLTAGARYEFSEPIDYIYILTAATADLTMEWYRQGRKVDEVQNVGAGYAEFFREPIDRIVIVSTGGQTVKFATRLGAEIRNDTPPNGNVTITGTPSVNIANVTSNYDYGKVRSSSGQNFIGGEALTAPATAPNVQLWNPAASGKTLYVERALLMSSGSMYASLSLHNAALTTLAQQGKNKLLAGANAVAQIRTQDAANPGTVIAGKIAILNNGNVLLDWSKNPIAVPQGYGLHVTGLAAIAGGASFEWFEE
ncbi:hypothetical protein [Lacisediminimonas profundi]|uniref:hypothetical protein n=1 Tax=Lacisediminimonas profundi TaxID=2603856 RepID=UPI00124B230A|nr:hypothetical protein [Lacisediminimonas profundi]